MGLIGAGGTLDILIPPSSILILYGAVSGESVSDLYIAGFLPGFILGVAICVEVWLICKYKGYGRPAPEDQFSWKEVAEKTKKSFWALLMPFIIMGGIYSGIFTVTEAAVVSVFYAVFVCFVVYRNIGIKELVSILNDSVVLTSMIYFIIMTATLFGFLVTMEQLSDRLLAMMAAVDIKPWMFLAIMNISIFIMGMFLTPGSIILIVLPIVYPILQQTGDQRGPLRHPHDHQHGTGLSYAAGGDAPLRHERGLQGADDRSDQGGPSLSHPAFRRALRDHLYPVGQPCVSEREDDSSGPTKHRQIFMR